MALINVPLSGQSLGITRDPINNNFSTINSAFAIDHVEYNTSGQGKHNKVTFPVQVSSPSFVAGEDGLFNLAYFNGVNTPNELFVHKQINNGAGTNNIPFTASILSQSVPAANSAGWTYLPSGILLRWEQASGTGLVTVTLNPVAPSFSAILTVIPVPWSTSTGSGANFTVNFVDILSTTQFRLFVATKTGTTAATGSFRVLIIGR